MTQISFSSSTFPCSCEFALRELGGRLSGKNIKQLTVLERNSINIQLKKVARNEYLIFLRNAILTNLVASALFISVLALPCFSVALISVSGLSFSLNFGLMGLALFVSAYVLSKIYFRYEDFKTQHISFHKHNYDALIAVANQIKRVNLRTISLPQKDKDNLKALFQELDCVSFALFHPWKLMKLSQEIMDSAYQNNSYIAMIGYICLDPEICPIVERIFNNKCKKAVILWGVNFYVAHFLKSLANMLGQNEAHFKKLILDLNFKEIFETVLS